MHPIAKIMIVVAICQVMQTSYTLRRLHQEHSGWRWWAEMSPLVVATILLVYLVLRMFEIIPSVAVI